MSKFLILGDIHGRTNWKNIYNKENPDKVIFLGDYVSTHDQISEKYQIDNLRDILNFKKENPDKVILLRGNHDMQHLGYYWASCSGLCLKVMEYMKSIKDEFLSLTQWIYVYNNIIFSHAGISAEWMGNNGILRVADINDMEPSEIFGFTPSKLSDYTGISATQPCTWIRPQTLAEYAVDGFDQVVGHTPVREISNLKDILNLENDIWLCDNLDGGQYLIYEDNKFIVKKL